MNASAAAAPSPVLVPVSTDTHPAQIPWWRRRWLRRLVLLIAIAAVGVALRATYFTPAPIPVTVARAETGTVEELVTNNKAGTVSARLRATLTPEIGGVIVRLAVKEGDQVRRGQPLLALSDTELRAQLELQERSRAATEATVTQTCAEADLASRNLDRTRRLADEKLVAAQTLDQAESQSVAATAACASARAHLAESAAAVNVARVALSKTVLRAPFDGVVSRVAAKVGEWMTPSMLGALAPTSAVDLLDTRSIYVRAPFDEVDAGKVRAGAPVRITMDAYPDRAFPGHVVYVSGVVSEAQQQNRTFDVDVEFDDSAFARTVLPGTSADLEVILRSRDGVLRIPTSAILQGGRVLVVHGDTLVSVPVRSGLANWDKTEIIQGLNASDRVVTSLDRAEVTAGARVTITSEAQR
jgi:HlyD family secretion protein